jgi:hypothetical protein
MTTTNKVKSVQTRRLTKAIATITCCLSAYAAAISLSAHDQASAFRAHRAQAPAIAAVYQTAPRTNSLAHNAPSAAKATLASTR